MTDWPGSNDYTISVQNPQRCFRDPDLRSARVERLIATGMPKVWTGNFAQVYELAGDGGRWAVKCFTRSTIDLRTRYASIAAAIARARLSCFVDFAFLDDEMLVNGARYPVVKMRWIDGCRLERFVEENLLQPRALLETANRLLRLVGELERRKIAHGDLQHGNVVVADGEIKLVDYDGMFVPAFAGQAAPEAGLPSYQHPRRSAADYGVGLDRFSALVIAAAMAALAAEPGLWQEFGGRDGLLFCRQDFVEPGTSTLMQRLRASDDPQVRSLTQVLLDACAGAPLDVVLPLGISSDATPRHRFWWLRGSAIPTPDPATLAPTDIGAHQTKLDAALSTMQKLLARRYRIRVNVRRWNTPTVRPPRRDEEV